MNDWTAVFAASTDSERTTGQVYWIGVMPELLAFHVYRYPKLTGCTGVDETRW